MTVPLISTCRTIIVLNSRDDNVINNSRKPCGFHLTRSKWDPYPWIEYVEQGSIADIAGLKAGDCLLQIDQFDVVGLRIRDIANLIKIEPGITTNLQIWRNNIEREKRTDMENSSNGGVALSGPLPILIRKFLKAISSVVGSLECPVCLETTTSPTSQCVHGHILCAGCRQKALRCPICRVRLGHGRCLIADEVHQNIREAFEDNDIVAYSSIRSNVSLKQKLFGKISLKSYSTQFDDCHCSSTTNDSSTTSHIHQIQKSKIALMTRLLRVRGFNRAISADNLSTNFENVNDNESMFKSAHFMKSPKIGESVQLDKTKSASTSELYRNNDENMLNYADKQSSYKLGQYLSVPKTPPWGGSIESLTTNSFLCPLSITSHCQEPLTREKLGEHLERVHNCKTQIHIYGRKTNMAIPLPFNADSIYIFHYVDELFIFQYQKEAAWMISTGTNNMEWILHAWSKNKTELKIYKKVLKIHETVKFELPCYRAPLSHVLSVKFIHIEIASSPSHRLL